MTDTPMTTTASISLKLPEEKWECVVFGDRMLLIVRLRHDISWTRRLITKILLGSTWKKLS